MKMIRGYVISRLRTNPSQSLQSSTRRVLQSCSEPALNRTQGARAVEESGDTLCWAWYGNYESTNNAAQVTVHWSPSRKIHVQIQRPKSFKGERSYAGASAFEAQGIAGNN